MHELGLLSPGEIRSWALAELDEPTDEKLLDVVLCDQDDADCITKHAIKLFESRGLKKLPTTESLRIYAAYVSSLIVRGEISPRNGADLIASATERYPLEFHDLDPFKYASSEMQDRPEDLAFFENAIMEEAKTWETRRASPPE
jgi:hypothetical protein